MFGFIKQEMPGYTPVEGAVSSDDDALNIDDRLQRNEGARRRHVHGRLLAIIVAAATFLVIVVVIVIVVVCLNQNDGGSDQASSVETTPCGPVAGTYEDGAHVFKGIPYVKPPVGARRWQKPEALDSQDGSCWNGVYEAKSFGSECFQHSFSGADGYTGSEDCLFLNVWTPTLDPERRLPVMVWIHGGFLLFANGSVRGYSPTAEMAAEMGFVFVSMNYRLGVLGFLALDVLSRNSADGLSGNYGLYDQLAALTWVQRNIARFGGDPGQVTVFGQSSGASSILAHLSGPMAKGLFQRAWMSSGSSIMNKTLEDAARDNLVFLKNIECDTAECLYGKSPTEVNAATPLTEYPSWGADDLLDLPTKNVFIGAIIVVDGALVSAPPLELWEKEEGLKAKTYPDVPLLIGTMAQENAMTTDPAVRAWDWKALDAHISATLGTFGGDLAHNASALYPRAGREPDYVLTSMSSDVRVTCPAAVVARLAADARAAAVWRYVVTHAPSAPIHAFGIIPTLSRYAMHGWDTSAFFGDVARLIARPTAADLAFQRTMRDVVAEFARTGKIGEPQWRTFPESTALLGASGGVEVARHYHAKQCALWLTNGLFSYAWIN